MAARTWRPDGVRAVHDRTGRRWTRSGPRWTCTGSHFIRWRVLIAEHGPLTEVPTRPATRTEPTT